MVWTCNLNDSVTAEQSQAAGKKWVALARKLTGNDEISSSRVIAVVGDTGSFMWVDTYPSLEVWAAVQTAWANSEEAAALDEVFQANETCSSNRLYRSVVVD
jgi:collagenase-like PrtC family protease